MTLQKQMTLIIITISGILIGLSVLVMSTAGSHLIRPVVEKHLEQSTRSFQATISMDLQSGNWIGVNRSISHHNSLVSFPKYYLALQEEKSLELYEQGSLDDFLDHCKVMGCLDRLTRVENKSFYVPRNKGGSNGLIIGVVDYDFFAGFNDIVILAIATIVLVFSLILVFVIQYTVRKTVIDPIRKVSVRVVADEIDDSLLGYTKTNEVRVMLKTILDYSKRMKTSLNKVKRLQAEVVESEKLKAIASTTQALCHDVRKPFSTVKSAFLAVESVESLEHLHDVLPKAKSQVDKALVSVEGMLTDVMELGKGSRLVCEKVSPKTVIKEVLEEVYQLHQKAKVQLEFDLKHQHTLYVDRLRVLRIFSNIINNAVQAIISRRGKEYTEGKIWIKTKEAANGMISFTLGNAGSAIPKDDCEKLFDAFYTSGKKGGTGLGLAIAKKITEAHGGLIRVESDTVREEVEFHFTLPASKELDRSELSLPDKLTAYAVIKTASKTQAGELTQHQQAMVEAFKALAADVQKTCQAKIRIALHDDEPIYRDGIVGLTRGTVLADLVEFAHFSSPEDILAEDPSSWHYVISDVDLMHADLNGYDVVRHLAADRRFQGACCIHSNNALTRDFEQASRAGAKGFQPKPMTFEHLLKFLLDNPPLPPTAQKTAASAPMVQKSKSSEPETSLGTPAKPLIAFVDDDEFLRSLYPKQVTDASIKSFASPEEFWAFAEDPLQLAMLTAVVSDNFFGALSSTTGIAFTRELRPKFTGIIVLCSDGTYESEELEHLDLYTSKGEFLGWKQMSEQLAADTPGMLRARIKAGVAVNTKSEAAKAMHAKARHDLQAFLSSLELAAISIERGQANPDLLRKMMIAKFYSAAHFLSKERIEHWRPPGLSLKDQDSVDSLRAWKVAKQREFLDDPFWQI